MIMIPGTLVMSATVLDNQGPVFTGIWYGAFVSTVLVLAGGVFAGLTLGLMGLDELHLRILSTSSSNPVEKENATKVLQLMSKGRHWILVVLLLCNVIINETLPIFLDDMTGGGISAVIISTMAIVIFGEIIPQAICVRYGLAIGARCSAFICALLWIFAPIAYPIAKFLDLALGGKENVTYNREEIKSFFELHCKAGHAQQEGIHDVEFDLINGVLDLQAKMAISFMKPIENAFTLSLDSTMDREKLDSITRNGISRIPIYLPGDPTTFVGVLSLNTIQKRFTYDLSKPLLISSFKLAPLLQVHPTITCLQALDHLRTSSSDLLILSRNPGRPGGAIGLLSMTDILQAMLPQKKCNNDTSQYKMTMRETSGIANGYKPVQFGERAMHGSISTPCETSYLLGSRLQTDERMTNVREGLDKTCVL